MTRLMYHSPQTPQNMYILFRMILEDSFCLWAASLAYSKELLHSWRVAHGHARSFHLWLIFVDACSEGAEEQQWDL